FFSLSSGKRGVYLLPAVPALAVATAPYVRPLLRVLPLQRAAWAIVLVACAVTAAAGVYFGLGNDGGLGEEIAALPVAPATLVLPLAAVAAAALLAFRPRRGLVALAAFFCGVWVVYGGYVRPRLDLVRSGRAVMDRAYAALPPGAELGALAAKEVLILHAHGALTNFGHRRPDQEQETFDAARWLAADPRRFLIVPDSLRERCFAADGSTPLGFANGEHWRLEPASAASPECSARGRADTAIAYEVGNRPPLGY
ncbi:MAG TPA: hypothetical protein VFO94_19805, partial [Gammaproteobacteria bacterium]|nr:hypothetical protein [Gammaproteobacteria bacterium]